MTDTLETTPRRKPVQKRSRDKVDKILAVARHLIEQNGIDQLTSLQVAKEAELPVGSVYFYFPNHIAIVDALAQRWLEQLREQFAALIARPMPAGGWRALLDDLLLITYGDETSLEHRRFEMEMTKALDFFPELQATRVLHADAVAETLTRLLEKAGAQWSQERLLRLARFGFEVIGALDNYLNLPDVDPAEALRWTRQSLHGLIAPCFDE